MIRRFHRRSPTPGFPRQTCITVKSWYAVGAPSLRARASSCPCGCHPRSSHSGRLPGLVGKRAWPKALKSQRPSHGKLLADIPVKPILRPLDSSVRCSCAGRRLGGFKRNAGPRESRGRTDPLRPSPSPRSPDPAGESGAGERMQGARVEWNMWTQRLREASQPPSTAPLLSITCAYSFAEALAVRCWVA